MEGTIYDIKKIDYDISVFDISLYQIIAIYKKNHRSQNILGKP